MKKEIAAAFEMVDIGPTGFYLGLKVERDREERTLKLSQPAYIDKILAKYHLKQAKPSNQANEKRNPSAKQDRGAALQSENNTKG